MQTKTDNRVYAGFFVRLAAYLLDWLIVGVLLLVVRVPVWISAFAHPNNLLVRDFIFKYSIADIVLYILTVAYFILLTYYTGATLGKRALQLRVVSTEDRRMTFFEVAYRETVGKFLSGVIIGIGYLMILIDKEKRGIHDLLADTCVVYYHEKKIYTHTPVVYRNMHTGTVTNDPVATQNPPVQMQNNSMAPQDPPTQVQNNSMPSRQSFVDLQSQASRDLDPAAQPMRQAIQDQPDFQHAPQPAPKPIEQPPQDSEM